MVVHLLSQVGAGLLHLDQHHVSHRDIKPDNILISLQPLPRTLNSVAAIARCVIADFGTSVKLNSPGVQRRSLPAMSEIVLFACGNVSPTWTLWGNQAHLAPEVLNDFSSGKRKSQNDPSAVEVVLDYTKQSVFELGTLDFEIVLGDTPVHGYPNDSTDPVTQQVKYSPHDIAPLPRYPPAFRQLLLYSIHPDPSRRIPLPNFLEQLSRFRST